MRQPDTTRLRRDQKTWLVEKRFAVIPGSAADRAEPPFRNGDRIVRIDDVPIDNYGQIEAELARKADQKIRWSSSGRSRTPRGSRPARPSEITDPGGAEPDAASWDW